MKEILTLKESNKKITSARDLFNNIKKINIDYSQENFILIGLNSNNEMIFNKILFKGGLNSCIVDIKTIFKHLFINDCNAFIIAHNHPSGCLQSSYEDIEIFKKLKQAGEILTLKCLDSIIFNKKEYYAMGWKNE